jgi:hypothetical protein
MEALPAGPEQLPLLTAPLGRVACRTLTIANPTAAQAHFVCSSSDSSRFSVSPSSFSVAAQVSVELFCRLLHCIQISVQDNVALWWFLSNAHRRDGVYA